VGSPDDLAWLENLTESEKKALLAEVTSELNSNKLADYKPYAKQIEFHSAGADEGVHERLLMAGNQLGKTVAGAFEAAMHLTGRYPDWWDGVMFAKETTAWAGSVTGQGTRDTVQRLLLGQVGSWGTGSIPKADIVDIKRASGGTPDLVESITVRHVSGGTSRITLKTYDQGRERWQGETLNFVWFDEEPPLDIYVEGKTRTNATSGIVWLTFTPLLGMSDVVKRFLIEKVAGTRVITMTIEDAEHYTPEQRKAIIAGYPAHEREARAKGIPTLGSGRIFPIDEDLLKEDQPRIPKHWKRIAGLDFGWDHPTATVWIAHDVDTDTVHLYDAYRMREATPIIHAATIRAKGDWIPVSWPHDGLQHDKGGSGEALADQYRKQGVNMLPDKATHPPAKGEKEGTGGNGVEAGLMEMLDRMQTGRLKVARHLNDWFEEFRLYHRDEGKIVKIDDDLMSATRYAIMMLRFAKTKPVPRTDTLPSMRSTVPGMGVLG
jgi:phage terminase large subunit-like protein